MRSSFENYLKIIFLAEKDTGQVKPQIVANRLQISTAAVTDMFKRLSEEGFIIYSPYKGARLTDKGIQVGRQMVRRHRIWEMYLCQALGFQWEEVHDEAERLEHASSDGLIDRLEELLGHPDHDPHGDPIPSKEGVFPKQIASRPLSSVAAGESVTVIRVHDFDTHFLAHLQKMGIGLGQIIVVKEILPFDGSILIEIDGKTETLSQMASTHIFVGK